MCVFACHLYFVRFKRFANLMKTRGRILVIILKKKMHRRGIFEIPVYIF